MDGARRLLAIAMMLASSPALAIEGSTLAGPIGGTDIRQAHLPPPGWYGGAAALGLEAYDFTGPDGRSVPALSAINLQRARAGVFLLYVPEFQLFGGSFGVLGVGSHGVDCGRLFAFTQKRCITGLGDPYGEIAWTRHFGTVRQSRYPDAFPIFEGLSVAFGFGVVFPVGRYDAFMANNHGVTPGNNIWDFAPNVAVTYVTPPILADGTEISGKLFWNNYLTNPETDYKTGSVLNVDFAVTERIGRWQIGAAGLYAVQVEDDKQFGMIVPPDGHRGEILQLGGIISYDMPEQMATAKVKVLETIFSVNTVKVHGVVFTFAKKLP